MYTRGEFFRLGAALGAGAALPDVSGQDRRATGVGSTSSEFSKNRGQ